MRTHLYVKMITLFAVFFCAACCKSALQPSSPFELSLEVKPIRAVNPRYQPNQLVSTLNSLRALGRERALELLRMYWAKNPRESARDEDIQIICRILFVRPEAWKPAMLGAAVPDTKPEFQAAFPLYPISISNGVPFLLAYGFKVGGGGHWGWQTLEECEHLELNPKDLPFTTRDTATAAARELIAQGG